MYFSRAWGIYNPIYKGAIGGSDTISWFTSAGGYSDTLYLSTGEQPLIKTDTLPKNLDPQIQGTNNNPLLCIPIFNKNSNDFDIALICTYHVSGSIGSVESKVVDKEGNQIYLDDHAVKQGQAASVDQIDHLNFNQFNVIEQPYGTTVPAFYYTTDTSAETSFWFGCLYPSFLRSDSNTTWLKFWSNTSYELETSEQYPDSEEEGSSPGKTGTLDFSSDPITGIDDPVLNLSAAAGGFNIYNINVNQLDNLFSNFVDINEYRNYSDFFISVHALPVAPNVGTSEPVKVADRTLDMTGFRVTSDYVNISIGGITTPETYKSFLDYESVIVKLFLPFVGMVDLKPEWVYDSTLSIDYKFNVIDGSFIAAIFSTLGKNIYSNMNGSRTLVASYSGSCSVEIPLIASNYANYYTQKFTGISNSMRSVAGGMLGGASTGGMLGAIVGGLGGAVSAFPSMMQAMTATPDVVQSNSYNSVSSFMGYRRPFLYFEWVKATIPRKSNERIGIPCDITFKLSDLKGYTEVGRCDLSSINCTDREKEMISEALSSGIIL